MYAQYITSGGREKFTNVCFLINMDNSSLLVYTLHANARPPVRSSLTSTYYDLYGFKEFCILPHSRYVLDTGLKFVLPVGTFGKIEPCIELLYFHHVYGYGYISATGTLHLVLYNNNPKLIKIFRNQVLGHLVIVKKVKNDYILRVEPSTSCGKIYIVFIFFF